MSSGQMMQFGPVTSKAVSFGSIPDAVVIDRVRAWALAEGHVEPTDSGQVMADKINAWWAAEFVRTVREWVQAEARTAGEVAARQAAADYFDVE